MASMFKTSVLLVLAALMICSHAGTSNAMQYGDACRLSDIHVSTAKTGKVVGGQPEYRVTIENICDCGQWTVVVACNGLKSTEPVDQTKIFSRGDGTCVVNAGNLISRGSPVVFTYAWNEPQAFTPTFAITRCP
ncbi:unnamed protein product [Urochloa decumbens]|uniref:Uncharacterized protein n=1 Tax=Urochloa decumbens TaxID=240449 RepID=A0ABC9AUA9_9POAL